MEDDPMLHAYDPAADPAPADHPWGAERRSAPRIEWPVTAHLLRRVSVGRGDVGGSEARTVNVSLSGILLAVPFECAVGEELSLRFPLDRGQELVAVARVVRLADGSDAAVREWLVGCEFAGITVKEPCSSRSS
jgi:hypothetical protein